MIAVDSKVTSVTVFNDRAEVNRAVELEIESGEQIVSFGDIPSLIDENSIKVDGKGDGVIKDVSIKKHFLVDSFQKNLNELLSQKNSLQEQIEKLEKQFTRIEKEKELIDSIKDRITTVSDREQRNMEFELDMQRWVEMIGFYREKLQTLDAEHESAKEQSIKLKKELEKVEAQIRHSGSYEQKQNYEVKVTIEAKESSTIYLNLSYIVYSASWKPIYDIRVSSEAKRVDISYNAMVTQNSGEDWQGVKVNLSTAKPSIGGSHPKLSAWHLHKVEIEPPMEYAKAPSPMPVRAKARKRGDESLEVGSPFDEFDAIPEAELMEDFTIDEAVVDHKIASAIFSLTQESDIPSDNTPHKVTIMVQPFDVEFRHSTIPKLSPFAYLQAKITNSSEYPLLAGDSNIYLDSSFVANSSIETITSGEDFWVFLGVDEGVKVEFKRLKKFKEKQGLISKEEKITFEYLTTITNNTKSTINLLMQDQLPISNDKDIVVEMIEPKYEKDSKTLKIDNQKFIEWKFELGTQAKKEIALTYSVKYPENMDIDLE
jgi:uncharacterized protein (TIGR02231 family)